MTGAAYSGGGRPRGRGDRTPGRSHPVALGSVLDKVLDDHGVLEQVQRQSVLEEWPRLVGDTVSRVTNARSVEEAVLVVEVRSSAWLMELNMMKGDFIRRVNEHMPETPIERIVFVQAETE